MKKVQGLIYIIIFVFTCLYCFGQKKKAIAINSTQKNVIDINSILKFKPTNQALMDSVEEEINPKIIIIDDNLPSENIRRISEKELLLLNFNNFRCKKKMNLLLQRYNLNNDSVFFLSMDNNNVGIYKKWGKLRERIDNKFGVNFIDSLIDIAEKKYVQNNIDKVFDFQECDTISRYSRAKYYQNYFENYKRDFWKLVKYPKDFKYRNGKDLYSYMLAEFILYKDGKVSDIKTGVTFQNNQNNIYAKYFRKKLIKFIKKSKWIPAKSAGITVTSKVALVIHFK
jgi:hypothetical protein